MLKVRLGLKDGLTFFDSIFQHELTLRNLRQFLSVLVDERVRRSQEIGLVSLDQFELLIDVPVKFGMHFVYRADVSLKALYLL